MKNIDNKSNANEIITKEMAEDKDFCLSIVKCKDRSEVKEFLISKGINASDNDIDNLAKNISEVADICKKLDDKDLDNIAGGDEWNTGRWKVAGETGAKILGWAAVGTAGVLFLTFVAAGIKKLGDDKGWWNKPRF